MRSTPVALVGLALALGACASEEQNRPERARDAAELQGRYRFEIYGDTGTVKLGRAGEYALLMNGELDASGDWESTAERLTVRDTVTGMGGLCPSRGVYRWVLSGDSLRLTPISDDCAGRVELFTAGWTRISDATGGEDG